MSVIKSILDKAQPQDYMDLERLATCPRQFLENLENMRPLSLLRRFLIYHCHLIPAQTYSSILLSFTDIDDNLQFIANASFQCGLYWMRRAVNPQEISLGLTHFAHAIRLSPVHAIPLIADVLNDLLQTIMPLSLPLASSELPSFTEALETIANVIFPMNEIAEEQFIAFVDTELRQRPANLPTEAVPVIPFVLRFLKSVPQHRHPVLVERCLISCLRMNLPGGIPAIWEIIQMRGIEIAERDDEQLNAIVMALSFYTT
jgi:hypothetical protein